MLGKLLEWPEKGPEWFDPNPCLYSTVIAPFKPFSNFLRFNSRMHEPRRVTYLPTPRIIVAALAATFPPTHFTEWVFRRPVFRSVIDRIEEVSVRYMRVFVYNFVVEIWSRCSSVILRGAPDRGRVWFSTPGCLTPRRSLDRT